MKNMRKYILLLSTLCLGLVSCVKENMPGVDADGLTSFRAVYADASTKTVLDGLVPMWTPADSISVFDGVNNKFGNSLSEPSATAEFRGKLEGKGRNKFLAASPYNAAATFSTIGKTVYGLQIPAEQVAVENSYDPSAMVSIAYSEDYTLKFKNMCSLVKFKVVSDGVTSVTFRAGNEETLAGTYYASYTDQPKIVVSESKASKVTLKGDFKKDSTYYLVTLPTNLPFGFTAILNGNIKSMEFGNPVALERSGIVNLGNLSLNPKESGLPENPGDDNQQAESGVVYFKPNSNWLDAGARFAAYFFQDGLPETWADLTEDTVSGVYKCSVPEGYTNVIFVRMNPANADNNWDNKWGQTADLAVPTGTDVCFVLEDGSWDAGYWTSYPPTGDAPAPGPGTPGGEVETAGTVYLKPNSNWLEAGARFAAYFWQNGKSEVWMSLTEDSVTGVYKCDAPAGYTNMIFVRMNPATSDNNWDNKWGQTADLNVPTGDAVCFVMDAGSWDNGYWTTYPPTVNDDPVTPDPGTDPDNPGGDNPGDSAARMLYLDPWQWASDSPRIEAYFFGDKGDAWVTMTANAGLYECSAPEGYANVIFVRMDPAKPAHNWDSKWNQTGDLVIPTDGKNKFTINSWDGDNGNSSGTWSVK